MNTLTYVYLFSFAFVSTKCGEVMYVPKITDTVFGCKDFDNKMLDCSGLVLGSSQSEEGESIAKLSGTILTVGEITTDYDIEIDIWKTLDVGEEFMYSTRVNFCSSIETTDTPWYPVIQSLNITSCPVPISSYEVTDITVSLDCVQDVMCHDFVGEYRIALSIMDKTNKLSCHVVEVCIVEQEVEE